MDKNLHNCIYTIVIADWPCMSRVGVLYTDGPTSSGIDACHVKNQKVHCYSQQGKGLLMFIT